MCQKLLIQNESLIEEYKKYKSIQDNAINGLNSIRMFDKEHDAMIFNIKNIFNIKLHKLENTIESNIETIRFYGDYDEKQNKINYYDKSKILSNLIGQLDIPIKCVMDNNIIFEYEYNIDKYDSVDDCYHFFDTIKYILSSYSLFKDEYNIFEQDKKIKSNVYYSFYDGEIEYYIKSIGETDKFNNYRLNVKSTLIFTVKDINSDFMKYIKEYSL